MTGPEQELDSLLLIAIVCLLVALALTTMLAYDLGYGAGTLGQTCVSALP